MGIEDITFGAHFSLGANDGICKIEGCTQDWSFPRSIGSQVDPDGPPVRIWFSHWFVCPNYWEQHWYAPKIGGVIWNRAREKVTLTYPETMTPKLPGRVRIWILQDVFDSNGRQLGVWPD
jgi:hypothetical protein